MPISSSTPSTTQNQTPVQFKPTLFSNLFGSTIATVAEVYFLHPFDTLVKNKLKPTSEWKQFLNEFKALNVNDKVVRSYKGTTAALTKKIPQGAQKWVMQKQVSDAIERKFSVFFQDNFGNYSKTIMSASAGAMTGIIEPLFVQPFDTMQVMSQNNGTTPNLHAAKNLGLKRLYRSTIFTALVRNLPGSVALFGVSEGLNEVWGNRSKESHSKNILAKFIASIIGGIVSHPGEIIKVSMQSKQISLRDALKDIGVRDLSRGAGSRLVYSSLRMTFAYFVAERSMKQAAEWIGEPLASNTTKCKF